MSCGRKVLNSLEEQFGELDYDYKTIKQSFAESAEKLHLEGYDEEFIFEVLAPIYEQIMDQM